MKPKVFIDGQEGTTGLQIYERLAARQDIELLRIDEDKRKDTRGAAKSVSTRADLVVPLPARRRRPARPWP